MTTLPLPDRPRTPHSEAGPAFDSRDAAHDADASRALSAVPTLESRGDPVVDPAGNLSIRHDLSIHPGLSLGTVPGQPAGTPDGPEAAEPLDRGSSDAAMLAVVTRVAAAVEVVVGGWLTVSPWLVGSNGSTALRWSNLAVGVLLVALGALRVSRPATPRGPAISFGLGAWTIVAAFVLSFQNGATGTAPLWNAIACGAVLTGAAAWATTEAERAGLHQL